MLAAHATAARAEGKHLPSVELDNDLAAAVVVYDLEFADVACSLILCEWEYKTSAGRGGLTVLLHDVEELDGDLGGRSDQDLALAHAVGVVDAVHGIGQNACSNHDGGCRGGIDEYLYLGDEG